MACGFVFIMCVLGDSVALAAPSGSAPPGAASSVIGGPLLATGGLLVDYPSPSVQRLPQIACSAFVVADAGTGQVLAAMDPHGQYLPASTLKVLTAVALIPVLNPSSTTVASIAAASAVPMSAGLVPGQRYKISDLFTALLTISANDAAVALAQATGSYAEGIALMNAEARRLQARDTVAVTPNGLDAPGQHVSAYDLALIARQALTMPAFLRYDQTRTAQFPVRPGHSETLDNQNWLLTRYPGAIGGKIGWTSAAGASYIGLAHRGGRTLIVTLLHCPALTEITSAEQLLDWGFAVDGQVKPVGTLVSPLPGPPAAPPAPLAAAAARVAGTAHREDAAAGQRPGSIPAAAALAAAGVACLAAGLGFAAARRQRLRRPR